MRATKIKSNFDPKNTTKQLICLFLRVVLYILRMTVKFFITGTSLRECWISESELGTMTQLISIPTSGAEPTRWLISELLLRSVCSSSCSSLISSTPSSLGGRVRQIRSRDTWAWCKSMYSLFLNPSCSSPVVTDQSSAISRCNHHFTSVPSKIVIMRQTICMYINFNN